MPGILLDHPVITERYFFPRPARLAGAGVVRVPVSGGVELGCHRTDAGQGSPWVLHFHGNGEVVPDWLDLADDLANARGPEVGVSTFLAEYRGYGASTGIPLLATQLDDALEIADRLHTGADGPPVPWERLVVYGRSIGSLYALHVAAHRPVGALILESGIADLGERLAIRLHPSELGVDEATFRAALAERFDHEAKLAGVRCPVVVIHTTHDHMVHVSHAHRLVRWAGARGRLVELPQGDHNSIFAFNASRILTEILGVARATSPDG